MGRLGEMVGRSAFVALVVSQLHMAAVLGQEEREKHPWCYELDGTVLDGDKASVDAGKAWMRSAFGELAKKYQMKGYKITEASNFDAVVQDLQENRKDFAIVPAKEVEEFAKSSGSVVNSRKELKAELEAKRLRLMGHKKIGRKASGDLDMYLIFSNKAFETGSEFKTEIEKAIQSSARPEVR